MIELIEFKNHQKETLRGLINKADSKIGVVLIHGFERTTVESKFKNIINELKGKVNLFRFDFSGCGLSDGKFENITVEKLSKELEKAISVFKKFSNSETIILVSHSFGCCVVLKFMAGKKKKIDKAVFLAPAFNQKELFKYWFVSSNKKERRVVWANFRRYFCQEDFRREMEKPRRMSKSHFVSNNYFLENENIDYQLLFKDLIKDLKNTLIVHGDSDDKVPHESNYNLPEDIGVIKVKGGDHELERMDSVVQYLDKIKKFILN